LATSTCPAPRSLPVMAASCRVLHGAAQAPLRERAAPTSRATTVGRTSAAGGVVHTARGGVRLARVRGVRPRARASVTMMISAARPCAEPRARGFGRAAAATLRATTPRATPPQALMFDAPATLTASDPDGAELHVRRPACVAPASHVHRSRSSQRQAHLCNPHVARRRSGQERRRVDASRRRAHRPPEMRIPPKRVPPSADTTPREEKPPCPPKPRIHHASQQQSDATYAP
jgi:hypothetical protein